MDVDINLRHIFFLPGFGVYSSASLLHWMAVKTSSKMATFAKTLQRVQHVPSLYFNNRMIFGFSYMPLGYLIRKWFSVFNFNF